SIYQMSREHTKLSMMATTIVALHLDGHRATIGHVGDSRLYRLTPQGRLLRETDDHSVVEEEVRAGRLTAEQAVHHPNRNLISRALGSEPAVEVDMKLLEVEDGTTFLLCSDGITGHIPDDEIQALLTSEVNLDQVCAEMKRRCYERGAQDNLTAVLVRIGESLHQARVVQPADDAERTVTTARPAADGTAASMAGVANLASQPSAPAYINIPIKDRSSVAEFPADSPTTVSDGKRVEVVATTRRRRRTFAGLGAATLLLLIGGASALAFWGGMRYGQREASQVAATNTAPTFSASLPTPTPTENQHDLKLREVDRAPALSATQMAASMDNQPLTSSDPEFLYLYGRASMLSGKHSEATEAFKRAADLLKDQNMAGNDSPLGSLGIEARVWEAAAALKSNNRPAVIGALKELDDVIKPATAPEAANESTTPPSR
nr:serine/threonine-protein phosphatase [Pyrinomonadaceae bacterium]